MCLSPEAFNLIGLSMGLVGSIMLIIYSGAIEGAASRASRDFLFPRWVYVLGSWLLPAGLLLQVVVAFRDVFCQ